MSSNRVLSRSACWSICSMRALSFVRPTLAAMATSQRRWSRGAGMLPRFAVFAAQSLRGFSVVCHDAFRWVIDNRPADLHSEVGEDAARSRDVTFLDVGDRAA